MGRHVAKLKERLDQRAEAVLNKLAHLHPQGARVGRIALMVRETDPDNLDAYEAALDEIESAVAEMIHTFT